MTTSNSTGTDAALQVFVQDHREALESFAHSDRQIAGLARRLLEHAEGAGVADKEVEG